MCCGPPPPATAAGGCVRFEPDADDELLSQRLTVLFYVLVRCTSINSDSCLCFLLQVEIRSADLDPAEEFASRRVENGTGKFSPDRLRLPFKPTVNRFREKNGKMEKQNGKTGGNGNGNGWGVFPTVFTVPVFSRENSRGNSRICRSRLCYLCWKRELLFACVPT